MLRLFAFALALAVAQPVTAQEMTDAEREAFGNEVRAYLLENPEVIMEAIEILRARQQQDEVARDAELASAHADALFNDPTSFVGGNPEGDITIVEFLDYRCGYCKRAFPEVEELIASDGNIRYIVKEFPILGEQSTLASRFALAVKLEAGDEPYKDVHNALMTFRGDIDEIALERLAESLSLDADAILDRMDSAEITAIISNNHALAQRLNISGTPSFVFEDQFVRGYVPLDDMRQIVSAIRG